MCKRLMESRLLSAAEGEVLVAYRLFLLQEEDGAFAEQIERSEDDVVTGGEGGVVLLSAADDHYPRVRMELWSDEPPRSGQKWEITRDESFTMSVTGRLELTGLLGMPSQASDIRLPHLGSYQIRAYVRGRREAAEYGAAEFFHGVEHWLLQIWPNERWYFSDEE